MSIVSIKLDQLIEIGTANTAFGRIGTFTLEAVRTAASAREFVVFIPF